LLGVTIAQSAIIGAGAVVVKDVKAGAIVYRDAAKFRRDLDTKI
jgi:acetyltransferase-like isoleucine patch superfamily enzyme